MDTVNSVFIDPSKEKLEKAVHTAIEFANRRVRRRLVSFEPFTLDTDSGYYWWDGGGVPNSYGAYATSSVAGVAWWTDPGNRVHVLVVGGRVPVSPSPFGTKGPPAFGLYKAEIERIHPAALVYPILQVTHPRKSEKTLVASVLRSIEKDPTDPASWSALADLELDGQRYEGRSHIKQIGYVLELLKTFPLPVESR